MSQGDPQYFAAVAKIVTLIAPSDAGDHASKAVEYGSLEMNTAALRDPPAREQVIISHDIVRRYLADAGAPELSVDAIEQIATTVEAAVIDEIREALSYKKLLNGVSTIKTLVSSAAHARDETDMPLTVDHFDESIQ